MARVLELAGEPDVRKVDSVKGFFGPEDPLHQFDWNLPDATKNGFSGDKLVAVIFSWKSLNVESLLSTVKEVTTQTGRPVGWTYRQ